MTRPPSVHLNGVSPRSHASRKQLLDTQRPILELQKQVDELRIRDVEVQKLHAFKQKLHNEDADLKESQLAAGHEVMLEAVKQERNRVRQQAEAALQQHLREQELERRRREEEERLRQQREAQAKAERDRRIREEQERLRKQQEEQARADAELQRQEKQRREQAERERQRQEEERKQKEQQRQQEIADRQKAEAQAQQEADQQAAQAAAKATVATADSADAVHKEYIELYLRIKEWKNSLWADLRQKAKEHGNPKIKEGASEIRSVVRSEVGKLSYGDKEINRMANGKLRACLEQALHSPAPVIGTRLPVNNFLPPSLSLNDNNATTITDLAAYFLCVLAQQVVKIFTSYVHGAPERAEPIGVMLTSIFAYANVQYARQGADLPPTQQSQSLFPIFLAKYHRVCPALFGITADQSTPSGKRNLGWALNSSDDDNVPKSVFVSDQTHYDRMTGLAIGYSSFALRNFANSTVMRNPYPPKLYWRSLAQLVNLPPNQVQPTHVCVLRHMLGHGGISRFLLFFGSVGVAVLREAYVEFPKRLPVKMQTDSFTRELVVFVEGLAEKEHLHLT